MSTALVERDQNQTLAAQTYAKIADPLAFARELGPAASSIMGAPLDQGPAIALTALCEGYTLVEMRRRYHWIGGRPVMQAAAMLAEFRMNHGGDYEVVRRDHEACEITFRDAAGRQYDTKLTWEECEQSRWPWKNWQDHSKGLKDNWATPLDRKTMMFARLVSDSLKFICPELAAGVYTPEEMDDVIEAKVAEPKRKASEVLAEQAAAAQVVVEADGSDNVVKADFEVVPEDTEDPIPQPARDILEPSAPGSVTDSQAIEIERLFSDLGLTADQRTKILAKRGVQVVRNLSAEQAGELITKARDQVRNAAAKN